MTVRETARAGWRLRAGVRIAGDAITQVGALAIRLRLHHTVGRVAAGAGRLRAGIRCAAGSTALVCASLLLTLSLREDRAMSVREAAGARWLLRAGIRCAGSPIALVHAGASSLV